MAKNTDEIIEKWFQERFHNSRISADETMMNQVIAAKEELKKLLSDTKKNTKETTKEENI